MASWRFSVGNLVSRAANAPAAVSPAAEDSDLPLANLGSGYPDEQAALQWRSDGSYAIDVDGNLLAATSSETDRPTGWRDLLNVLAGTPGLPANPPDWGTYAGRTALRVFRPAFQDVDVMPGESVKITGSIYVATASDATGVEVRVIDLTTGHQFDAGGAAWDDDGKIEEQTTLDTWKDFAVTITADTTHTERRRYRVIVSPQPTSGFSATTYVYISANGGSGSPALFPEVDTVALIGHRLPVGATVSLVPQPAGTSIPLTLVQPSCYAVAAGGTQLVQTWRLSISIPSALRPTAPRPIIGELWIGKARTLDRSPQMAGGLGYSEGDRDQVRVEAARGRLEVLSDGGVPASGLDLTFRVPDADYLQVRDAIMRLTSFGAEPMLLIPSSAWEGGRFYHGRVGEEIRYARITAAEQSEAWREFTLAFAESPLAIG